MVAGILMASGFLIKTSNLSIHLILLCISDLHQISPLSLGRADLRGDQAARRHSSPGLRPRIPAGADQEIAKAVAEIVTQEADVKTSQPRSRVSWKASTPARSRTRSRPRSPPSGLWARSIFTRMLRAHIHLRVRPPVILAIPPGPHPAEWRP